MNLDDVLAGGGVGGALVGAAAFAKSWFAGRRAQRKDDHESNAELQTRAIQLLDRTNRALEESQDALRTANEELLSERERRLQLEARVVQLESERNDLRERISHLESAMQELSRLFGERVQKSVERTLADEEERARREKKP